MNIQKRRTFLRRTFAALFSVILVASFCISGIGFPSIARADIQTTIGYQGRLKDSSGSFLTGDYDFVFRLYASSTGGAAVWTEAQTGISIDAGAFTVRLGSITPFPTSLDFNQVLFLSTEVNGDGEMSPRVVVNSVPYAYTAGGVTAQASTPTSTVNGGRMFYNTSDGSLQYYDAIATSWKTLGISTTTVETLASVTTRGNTTTNAIQFGGGTSTASFAFSSALSVTGNTSLQALTFTNGTATNLFVTNGSVTNATSTNFFATNLFGTNAAFESGSITNGTITSLSFTSATGTNLLATSSTIQTLTSNTASVGTLTVTSASATTLFGSSFSFTNGTSTGSLGFNSASGSSLFAASIQVNGSSVCLANGANCPADVDTLLSVTNRGSVATSTLTLYGGATISNLTVTGTSDFQNTTFANGTGTTLNVTGFLAVGGIRLDAVGSSALTSGAYLVGVFDAFDNSNATTIQATLRDLDALLSAVSSTAIQGLDTLQSVTARGNVTTSTITTFGGLTTSNLTATGTTSLQATTFTNASGTTLTLTGTLSAGSSTVTTLNFSNATGNRLFATSLVSTTSTATDIVTTNLSATNGTSTNFFATNLFGASATIGTGSISSAAITSLSFTSATGTNLLATSGTIQTLTSDTATIGSLSATNATATTIFGSSLVFTNGTSTGWFGFGTASGSNLFVQGQAVCLVTGTNCPAEADTLLTVTNRGSVATAPVTFYGGATIGAILTATGTTSLQATTFTNATGTTLALTGSFSAASSTVTTLNFSNATGNRLFATDLVGTNGTITNGTITNLTATNASTTFLAVTSRVTTDLLPGADAALSLGSGSVRWNAQLANATGSTLALSSNFSAGSSTVTTLNFSNATGSRLFATSLVSTTNTATDIVSTSLLVTNATSTNLYISGAVSTTELYVTGKRACLEDGTNCTVGGAKSASSSANTALNATEAELLAVTINPTFTNTTVWISGTLHAVNSGALLSSTITARVRRGACTTGVQVGVDRIVDVGILDSDTLSVSFVDTPSTSTSITYRMCAIGSGGTPAAQDRSMVVQIVKQGADVAEVYYTDDETIGPGDVVAVDPTKTSKIMRSGTAYDPYALGVISTQPGSILADAKEANGSPVLLALAGRVPVKVSVENGPIKAGDNLTSASTPGYAMKATRSGVMVGRALSDFAGSETSEGESTSTGMVMMFVQNGYYLPLESGESISLGEIQNAAGGSVVQSATSPTDIFDGSVIVKKHLAVSVDAAGEAKILAGDTDVRVRFDEPYAFPPIVTITPHDFVDAMYRVTEMTDHGFMIQLNTAQSGDRVFSWHALGSEGGRVFVSDGTTETLRLVIEAAAPPEDILPQPSEETVQPVPPEEATVQVETDASEDAEDVLIEPAP